MTADKARKRAGRRVATETGKSYTAGARSVDRWFVKRGDVAPRCEDGCTAEQYVYPNEDSERSSALEYCGYCGNRVCLHCGTAPVGFDGSFLHCKPCSLSLADDWDPEL